MAESLPAVMMEQLYLSQLLELIRLADPTQRVQVPEAAAAESRPVPGRMVTRAEKLAAAVETWATRWEQVDAGRLRPVQRQRLAAAVDALEAQVVRLRAGLVE